MSHKAQIDSLLVGIADFAGANGEDFVQRSEVSAKPLLLWLEYLNKYCLTGVADELLQATSASVREASALLGVGLIRPCLFSMRAQIDLALGWIYFKDHRVEYELVNRTGDGFKLKKDILNYMRDSFASYGEKITVLTQIATRRELDPYRLLSAHIHAQSNHVVPGVVDLCDVIYPKALAEDCIEIQADVAEFLADQLFSSGIASRVALPAEIIDAINTRKPTLAQRVALFK